MLGHLAGYYLQTVLIGSFPAFKAFSAFPAIKLSRFSGYFRS
jgi:hypothetical protein